MSITNMVEAVVVFEAASLLPEDAIVNTWHWHQPEPNLSFPDDIDNVRDMLHDFYFTSPTGGGNPIVNVCSKRILSGKVTFKFYNMMDAKPRAPFHIEDFTAAAMPTSDALPAELSCCLSYQAVKESGKPQARRRGRIYLPPPAITANSSDGRPTSSYRGLISDKATELKAASDASLRWEWVVWSVVNQDHSLVDNGWVDDAWDIQRRRGVRARARGAWS